jgi:hypothetical protein
MTGTRSAKRPRNGYNEEKHRGLIAAYHTYLRSCMHASQIIDEYISPALEAVKEYAEVHGKDIFPAELMLSDDFEADMVDE